MNNNIQTDSSQNQRVSDIYKQYQNPLRGFIAKRVPSKEDCEDILQDVFYQLAKIDLEENPIQQISAWLYSVARNKIIDKSRKQKEEEMSFFSDDTGESHLIKEITDILWDETSSPETEILRSYIWEELEEALSELPPEQKNVFELTELQGFSFKEIAESTGITINTLISRKRYAVVYLRKRLYNLYEELFNQ